MIFGECRGKARRAARLYAQRFPQRAIPSYKVILRLISNARQGNFTYKRVHRPRHGDILRSVRNNPNISIREIARRTGFSVGKIQKDLKKARYHPYHIYLHQSLSELDRMRRREFCHWGSNMVTQNRHFFRGVLFSDESTFVSDGSLNRHNSHYWSNVNPHWIRQVDRQHRWSVNVWCGILNNKIIGPYFFDGSLDGAAYSRFIEEELPQLLEDVPLHTRVHMWYQQDGCPAHYSLQARRSLSRMFGNRWIGRGGPIS